MKCNKLSADVWNYCVKTNKEYEEQNDGKQMPFSQLQSAVKNFNELSSKNIQKVFMKYYNARNAMWKSIKAQHENSSKVKMPYKEKKFFNTGWDYQHLRYDYDKRIIKLSKGQLGVGGFGKKQKPVKCYVKSIPDNIKEIELLYRKGLKLAIKYTEPDIENVIQSDNSASIDLGEIHSITSIDRGGNAIIITGRKIRSIKRLRNKELAKIRSLQSNHAKCSRKYKRYSKAMYNLKYKTNNQINDCIHKTSKLYLDYCIKNQINTVYYGDLDSCTRNTKERVGKHNGQKLAQWNHGQLMQQLENKLSRYGIKLIKISEAYTSQKCPYCKKRNKPTNRNYVCKKCGYTQHRDIVGAINILNDNAGYHLDYYRSKTYLQII